MNNKRRWHHLINLKF